MAAAKSSKLGPSNDSWSIFLRQKRLQDQLRRLRTDFKSCYCPPGCRGRSLEHNTVDLLSLQHLPGQYLHAPYVGPASVMPRTRARPASLRDKVAVAEARGISYVLLHRSRTRATLRMSLQVYMRPEVPGMRQYFGEIFITRPEQEEQFIGFIQAHQLDRNSDEWVTLHLGRYGEMTGDNLLNTQVSFKELLND